MITADVEIRLHSETGAAGGSRGWEGNSQRQGCYSFSLKSNRSRGRLEDPVGDCRKKLELFQRCISGEDYNAPLGRANTDAIEACVVYLKDKRGMADSSRKSHLDVLRSFFKTVSRRLRTPDPSAEPDEVRFHQKALRRSFPTKPEADLLLTTIKEVNDTEVDGPAPIRR